MALASYFSAALLLARVATANNCSIPPIFIDIHKRLVHDTNQFEYGSFIGVATPAQNHSLWPSLSQNLTSFATSSYCNSSTLQLCSTSTGGFFDVRDSTTFVKFDNFKTLDPAGPNFTVEEYGQDTLRLYTHYFETDPAFQTLVTNTTIEVVSGGSIVPGRVGLGSASTLMQNLITQNLIAGKTYSLFIGHGFDRAGGLINGSNLFGGYDSGRFVGTPHQYPMNYDNMNPMGVQVKDITITNSNDKSNVSLFDNSKFSNTNSTSQPAPFEAQITTDQFALRLPAQITRNFKSLLNADKDSNNTWNDNSLKANSNFNGSLTITLSDGFQITLPPEVLVNASNITPIEDNDDDSGPFYLGTAFLGQAYLMADFESQVFFLAEAVVKNNVVMPVIFCPRSVPAAYIVPHPSAFVMHGLIGAVIGGVIGGSAIMSVLICAWISWTRKKDERKLQKEMKRNHNYKMAQMEIEERPMFDPPPTNAAKAIFVRRNKGWFN